jgi:aspartate/glutamate racemase
VAELMEKLILRPVDGNGTEVEPDQLPVAQPDFAASGAEEILLGCTETDLLVGQADTPLPFYDTTRLHAERAVELALA